MKTGSVAQKAWRKDPRKCSPANQGWMQRTEGDRE